MSKYSLELHFRSTDHLEKNKFFSSKTECQLCTQELKLIHTIRTYKKCIGYPMSSGKSALTVKLCQANLFYMKLRFCKTKIIKNFCKLSLVRSICLSHKILFFYSSSILMILKIIVYRL